MLLLGLPRRLPIPRNARNRTPQGPCNTIPNTLPKITELPLRLLRLALLILLRAGLLQTLIPNEPAECFFARADGLVPGPGAAVLVVRGDARGGDADAADGAAGVGEGVFGFGFAAFVVGLFLVGGVAG